MNYKLHILLGILIFLTACKKESIEPDDLSEVPVFSVTGTVDGQPVSFYAGVDGAYLTTYNYESHGVDCFSGKIIRGSDFVDFGIYDGNVLLPGNLIPELGTNFYLTSPFTSPLIHIEKSQFSNAADIAEIEISLDGVPVGNTLSIYEPGIYTICVNVMFADASNSTMNVCNDIVVGYRDHAPFIVNHSMNNSTVYASIGMKENVAGIQWFVDGVVVSNSLELSHQLTEGIHELKARVTFTNGVVSTRTIIVDGSNENRFLEDVATFKETLLDNQYQDFKGRFSLSIGGVLYTHIGDAENTSLEVTGITPFGKNSAGKEVYKVSGNLTTQMKNTVTQSIVDAQFAIVIGVEIE